MPSWGMAATGRSGTTRRSSAVVARGDREYLDPVLALPRDLDRRAEHGVAPALRNAHRDLDAARGERAQLAAVRGGEVGVRDNQDAVHDAKTWNAEGGTRNRRADPRHAVPPSAFPLPRSPFPVPRYIGCFEGP